MRSSLVEEHATLSKADPTGAILSPRPVRVCFLIDHLHPAGTEMQLLALIQHLDRSRIEPHLCLLKGEDEVSHALTPTNCPILRLGVRSLRRISTVGKAWRFAQFLRRHRIDVLEANFPDSIYFGVPIARLAGVRRVVRTRRNLGYWMTPTDRRLSRLCGHLVDATITNSDAVRRSLIESEHANPATVVVLENGVDLSRFTAIPALEADPDPSSATQVGLVANLRPVKDPELFVRAAARVAADHPGVGFQIAGGGELRPQLEQLIAELGLRDRMTLLGSIDDVPALLARLDIAVLCSRSEGLPNALLEYMAAGRAIVATSVGGNAEVIEDEVNGLLVPPGEVDRLVSALDRLLRDRPLAARLGAAARQRAAERFDFQARARVMETFYQRLVDQPRGRWSA